MGGQISRSTVSPKSAWVGLTVLSIAVFGAITIEVAPIGLLPDIMTAFGVNKATAGLLVSMYAGLIAVSSVPLTRLTRRVARKPLLLITLAIFSTSNLWAAVADSFEMLVAARTLGGLAHSLFFAVVIGYAARIAPVGQTGRAIALVATGTSIGIVLGLPAGTALGELIGWRATFASLGILVGLCGVMAMILLPPVSHDAEAGKQFVPGGGRLIIVAGLAGLCFLGYYTLYTYVSPMLLDAGLAKPWLSGALVAFGIAGFIGIRLVAPHLDRHPFAFMVFVPATLVALQAGIAIAYPALWPLLIVVFLWTGAFGPVNSTYQNMLVRVGKDNPEMAGAWINSMCNLGIGAGGAIGGVLVMGSGYAGASLTGAGIIAIALAIAVLGRRALTRA
nr:MFS transporter [Microbacterium sp. NC79]